MTAEPWTKCSDALPTKTGGYLTFAEGRQQVLVWSPRLGRGGGFGSVHVGKRNTSITLVEDVTHWKHLTEDPKP